MKTFCIIPARYDSARVRGKLLWDVLDRPLIEWVWKNASKVSSFSDVFIATDSKDIANSAEQFGGKIIMTSSSHQSGTDRVAEAARKLNTADDDIIINIQADEPLISPSSVENLILSLRNSQQIEMATLAYPSSNAEDFKNSNIVKVVVDKDDFALYFSRSPVPFLRDENDSFALQQDMGHHVGYPTVAPRGILFLKHLGIYGYRMNFLQHISLLPLSSLEKKEKLEQLRVLENGRKIKVIMSDSDSESINTQEDFEVVERLLKERV